MKPEILQKLVRQALKAQPVRSVLTMDGREHVGTLGTAQSARRYRPEGYSPDYRKTWVGLATDFAAPPHTGKRCRCDGSDYEVATNPEVDAANGIIRIDLRLPTSAG